MKNLLGISFKYIWLLTMPLNNFYFWLSNFKNFSYWFYSIFNLYKLKCLFNKKRDLIYKLIDNIEINLTRNASYFL